VRVFIDTKKLEDWPEIKAWFLKLKAKKDQDPAVLRDQIIEAGTEILSIQRVHVDIAGLGKKGKGAIATCPMCGEAYPAKDGAFCLACQGGSPYGTSPEGQAQGPRPGLKVVTGTKAEKD
jgi:formylmethanofuran dehydrogenase subunit E